jgi:hypothetical protein
MHSIKVNAMSIPSRHQCITRKEKKHNEEGRRIPHVHPTPSPRVDHGTPTEAKTALSSCLDASQKQLRSWSPQKPRGHCYHHGRGPRPCPRLSRDVIARISRRHPRESEIGQEKQGSSRVDKVHDMACHERQRHYESGNRKHTKMRSKNPSGSSKSSQRTPLQSRRWIGGREYSVPPA